MKKRLYLLLGLVLSLILTIGPSVYAKENEQKVHIEYLHQTNDNELIVHFNSRLDDGIAKEDTTLKINGEEVEGTLQAFSDTDETMSYYILTDISKDADKDILSITKTVLKEIVKDKKTDDTVSFITKHPSGQFFYLSDKKKINKEIDKIKRNEKQTNIFDKVESFIKSDKKESNIRKRLVVCSDGKGKKNTKSYDDLIHTLKKSNIPVDVVCITNPMAEQTAMQQANASSTYQGIPMKTTDNDISKKLEEIAKTSAGGYYYSLPLTGDKDKQNAKDAVATPVRNRIDNSISIVVDLANIKSDSGVAYVELEITKDEKTYVDSVETELTRVKKKSIPWGIILCLLGVILLMICLVLVFTREKKRKVMKPVVESKPDKQYGNSRNFERNTIMMRLVIASDSGIEEQTVTATEVIIGRLPSADITIAYDSHISGKHCKLKREGNRVTVTDLQSQNGTWLGRTRITGTCEVHPGDILTIGRVQIGIDWR